MLPPESDYIEYKEGLTNDIEREVVAFLNNKEGREIYIWVKNNGDIVGVPDCDDIQLTIKDNTLFHKRFHTT